MTDIITEILEHAENRESVQKAITQELANGADLETIWDRLLDLWSFNDDMWPQPLPDEWENGEARYTNENGWL